MLKKLKGIADRLRGGPPLSSVFPSTILSSISEGFVVYDRELRFQIWNSFMEGLTGLPASEVLGRPLLDVFPELEELGVPTLLSRALDGVSVTTDDARFRVPHTGKEGWVTARYDPYRDAAGEVVGVVAIVQDISVRKRAERALEASQRLLSIHAEIAEVFLTVADEEMYERVMAIVLEALDSKHGLFGYIDTEGNLVCPSMTKEIFEQCRMSDTTVVFPRESWGGIWGRSLKTKKSVLSNVPGQVPEGHIGIDRCVFVPIVEMNQLIGLLAVANRDTDYTDEDRELMESIVRRIGPILHARLDRAREERDRLRAEEEVRASERRYRAAAEDLRRVLAEKDALLKEVHHRVKNNMAVISSLVSLQGDNVSGRDITDVLARVGGRIRAMSLVHEQIYRSGDFREVDLGDYAGSLINALFQTRSELVGKVELRTEIADVAVALDLAIPCGLILNELISNSLEHAFPGERRGEIVVALGRCEDGRAELRVVDDGVGSTGADDGRPGGGFGLQLVDLLTKQLSGEIEMSFNDGADIRVRFPLDNQ